MDTSPKLKLPYIAAAQAQKHVTHNEALRLLDVVTQASVLDRTLASPPAAPAEGACYLPAVNAAGAWAGQNGKIAAWQDGAWVFLAPQSGWRVWVANEAKLIVWNGAAWVVAGGEGVNPAPFVGVNTVADAANRLSVKSDAALFDNAGAGHQLKINKASAGATASLLFQTGYSGRAEIGSTGDDNLHVKVSANGSVWNEAIVIDRVTGAVSFPRTNSAAVNPADVGFDVILVAGQDNARGNGAALDAALDAGDPRVLQFAASGAYAGLAIAAAEPLLHAAPASLRIGHALAFAKLYAASIPTNRRVLLVPAAGAGAGFGTGSAPGDWTAGNPGGALYEAAIRQAGLALASGPKNRFVGVLWHQGEADAALTQAVYGARLDGLIAGLRARIAGAANAWFLIGRLTPENVAAVSAYSSAIDPAHLAAPSRNAYCAVYSGQPGYVNDPVADFAAFNALGQRFLGLSAFAALPAAQANLAGAANPAAPAQVAGLAAGVATANSLTVSWSALTQPPLDYCVQSRQGAGAWKTAARPYSSATSVAVSGLLPYQTYEFRVAGVNSSGLGAWSASVTGSVLSGVTGRNPGAADDSSHGYSVNGNWLNALTGSLFKATSVAAGAAVWAAQPNYGGPICGQIATAPALACALVKIVAAYAGKCLRLQRSSDNTQLDIGFIDISGQLVVDSAAADAFVGTAVGTVVRVYDQSGNGRDLVAGANPPLWTANSVNGYRAVTFDSSLFRSLNIPASVVLDRANYTALLIQQATAPAQGSTCYLQLGTDPSYVNDELVISSNTGTLSVVAGSAFSGVEGTPSVLGLTSAAGGQSVFINEASGSGVARPTITLTGGAVGIYTNTYTYFGEMLGVVLYSSALSAADFTVLKLASYANFKITPQLADRLVFVGDSITAGADSNPDAPFWRQAYPQISRQYQVFPKGASGQTVAFWNTSYANAVAPLYRSAAKNNIFFFCGTNDLNAGTSAATLCDSAGAGTIRNFCLAARATGFKVIVATILPRPNTGLPGGPTAFDAVRTTLNANLRANWAGFADGLCDFAADPVMGLFNAGGLDPVYYAGSLHPTKAGAAILAGLAAASVNALG